MVRDIIDVARLTIVSLRDLHCTAHAQSVVNVNGSCCRQGWEVGAKSLHANAIQKH
jgi:hypothetical protein